MLQISRLVGRTAGKAGYRAVSTAEDGFEVVQTASKAELTTAGKAASAGVRASEAAEEAARATQAGVNADRIGAGRAATFVGLGKTAAIVGVPTAGILTGKWYIDKLGRSAADVARNIEDRMNKAEQELMSTMHMLEAGAKGAVSSVVGGSAVTTAFEGILGVVVIGGIVYGAYELYRVFY